MTLQSVFLFLVGPKEGIEEGFNVGEGDEIFDIGANQKFVLKELDTINLCANEIEGDITKKVYAILSFGGDDNQQDSTRVAEELILSIL